MGDSRIDRQAQRPNNLRRNLRMASETLAGLSDFLFTICEN